MWQLLGASQMFAHIRIYTMNHRQIDTNYKFYTVATDKIPQALQKYS